MVISLLIWCNKICWIGSLPCTLNAHRLVALCVAYFLLIGNANERVHGAYGGASEGSLLLVDHAQSHTPPCHGVDLAWKCRLRPCASHMQLPCPRSRRAGDPDIAKPHTHANNSRVGCWRRAHGTKQHQPSAPWPLTSSAGRDI